MNPPPLTLYIHIPWCIRKCPYCDFNSHERAPDSLPQKEYVQALLQDLESDLELAGAGERPLQAVFIGGGTPSLFEPERIADLLQGVRRLLPLSPEAEVTMEANPGALETQKLPAFREAGINRLSLGVQSFSDDALARLGRVHSADEAHAALQAAAEAGFASWNLDLMYALPQQQPQQALQDLEQALQYAPPHLSWYQLTLEPNTLFHSKPPPLPGDELIADMEQAGGEALGAAGYRRYEVSAWSSAREHRCRHNLNYWRFGDYLGIGAGAHGKLTRDGSVVRTTKLRQPDSYLGALQRRASQQAVEAEQLPLEFMLGALRLTDGVPCALYEERTGLAWDGIENALFNARALGLLEDDPERLRPTPTGLRYLNDLLGVFM